MDWHYTPLAIPLLITAAVAVWLAFHSWKRRPLVGATPFALLMLAMAVWLTGDALRLVSVDLSAKLVWAKVRYLGIVTMPAAWLIFVLQRTGRERWLVPRYLAVLTVEPLIILFLVWTNDAHHLIWSDIWLEHSGSLAMWNASHGAAFWVHAAYSYCLLAISMLPLVQAFAHSSGTYRAQTAIVLIGVLVPAAGNIVSTFNLLPLPLDLTPFAFTLFGLPVAWGVFRSRLFDIMPIARRAVVDSMSGGVIVLDLQNRIVDINPAAENIIGRSASEVIGQLASRVLADKLDIIERYHDVAEAYEEITLGEGEVQRHYELRLSPLHDRWGRLSGRLIVVHDITEHKQAEARLMAQKRLLESLVAMARATIKLPSLEATLQSALNMAATLTEAEHGSMFLLSGTGEVTHSVLARGEATPAQRQDLVNSVMRKGLAGWVVGHRQPALVRDTAQDDRWLELPGAPYMARSALAIPIVSGSAVLGVITLTHSEPNHFNTEHAYLIQTAANQIALAVRNAQMYDEQRRLADRQTTLYQVLRTVGEHLDPNTIAHAAVESVARLTGWSAVAILLPDDTGTHLAVRAAAGALSAAEGQHILTGQGVTGLAFQTAQTQYLPDVSVRSESTSGYPVFQSELAVPLRCGDRMVGVLHVASDSPAAFDAEDILLARSMAEAIGLAVDNAQLYAEARQYAADLSALYTVARAISQTLILEDVLAETLHSALTTLDFDAGLISLADPSDGHLYLAAERGLPPEMAHRLRERGLEETLCAYVHKQSQAISVDDIEQQTEMVSELEKEIPQAISEMRNLGMRAYSGIPLIHEERSLGTLSLFARQPRVLAAKDPALQMAIGRQIATAVTNARLFQAVAGERSRLQAMIESSRDGIILIGMNQRMLVINAPALEFLRLSGQPEDWINRSIRDAMSALELYAPQAVRTILAEIDRVQMGDTSPGDGECEVPPRSIHWMNLPVMADKTPLGRLLVLRDVTEERLLERMRDDLVHAMVHDLRNPLAVISGALDFLDEDIADLLSPTQRQLWEITQDNTEGMLKLVKAILEISQLESRQMPLEHAVISLADLAADVLDSQLPLAVEKDLHLESDIPSDLPPAWGDATLLKRVLQNLVSNAIKFTPAGGVVRVTARADPSEEPRLLVSVSDTGPGVPAEIQDRLFQKFVTGRQLGHGSGLGLAFCKMVIEAHGERIWLDNTYENGAMFTFTLPLPPTLES